MITKRQAELLVEVLRVYIPIAADAEMNDQDILELEELKHLLEEYISGTTQNSN